MDIETRQTVAQFIERCGVTMAVRQTDNNPNMDDGESMDHWRCVLKCRGLQFTLIFSQGRGHNGAEPDLPSVLSCLASDASGIENARDFSDWCAEYGYSDDSRKAERTFKACKKQAERLEHLLGRDNYLNLLWETEQL